MTHASSTVMGHRDLLLILSLLIGAPPAVEPVAYPVKWDMSQPSHAADTSSFNQEAVAYPVKWDMSRPSHVADTSSFKQEAVAYPAKWDMSQPSHAVDTSSFEQEAYPSQQQGGPSSPGSSFVVKPTRSPYPMKWLSPPDALAASDVAGKAERDHGIHVEPGTIFLRRSLFPGAILPEGTRFAGAAAPAPRRFISRAAADAIPFGYKQLNTVLRMFRIPRGSTMADEVADTLRTCEEASPEPHTCATSQQAAAAFAAAALGTIAPRAVVTVVHGDEAAGGGARYAVAPDGVARIGGGGGEAVVPCHPMPYPYMVHYCHQPAGVEALRVELQAAAGGGVSATAVAMCHADTTSWDGRYFRMLNATRGEEICHFMPRDYVLWLPAGGSV